MNDNGIKVYRNKGKNLPLVKLFGTKDHVLVVTISLTPIPPKALEKINPVSNKLFVLIKKVVYGVFRILNGITNFFVQFGLRHTQL